MIRAKTIEISQSLIKSLHRLNDIRDGYIYETNIADKIRVLQIIDES